MTTQEEHDALHPGLTCQNCPRTLAFQAKLQERARLLRLPWWKRWLW